MDLSCILIVLIIIIIIVYFIIIEGLNSFLFTFFLKSQDLFFFFCIKAVMEFSCIGGGAENQVKLTQGYWRDNTNLKYKHVLLHNFSHETVVCAAVVFLFFLFVISRLSFLNNQEDIKQSYC